MGLHYPEKLTVTTLRHVAKELCTKIKTCSTRIEVLRAILETTGIGSGAVDAAVGKVSRLIEAKAAERKANKSDPGSADADASDEEGANGDDDDEQTEQLEEDVPKILSDLAGAEVAYLVGKTTAASKALTEEETDEGTHAVKDFLEQQSSSANGPPEKKTDQQRRLNFTSSKSAVTCFGMAVAMTGQKQANVRQQLHRCHLCRCQLRRPHLSSHLFHLRQLWLRGQLDLVMRLSGIHHLTLR